MDPEFGDISPDDVFTVGDEDVSWAEVERLASQIESIDAIEDPEERLTAAKNWAYEMEAAD